MQYIERRNVIMELITKDGFVRVSDLAKKFDVGDFTIRRDLKYLVQNFGIQLAYGGAIANDSQMHKSISETKIAEKRTQNLEQKRLIAKKAAGLIEDGDTIALNEGSTVELILDYIENLNSLNLITLSLNVAMKASTKPFINVYMPGGKLRNESGAFYGSDAETFLEKFSVDKVFFGVVAVGIKSGVTHPVLEEVNVNRILAKISRKIILVADSSKFDKISLVKMVPLEDFDTFVVDDDLPEAYRKYAELNNIDVI